MSRLICNFITLFSLIIFPVLPGLCECIDAPPTDHGCCHEETDTESWPYPPCPDELHLCFLNPPDVDVVTASERIDVSRKVVVEFEIPSLTGLDLFSVRAVAQAPPPEPRVVWISKVSFLHSDPSRGPPYNAS